MENNSDSLSSGERNGKSPNQCGVIGRRRCRAGVVGLVRGVVEPFRELQTHQIAEFDWKVEPQEVTAP